MIYALTTPNGRVFEFYIKSCADLYHGMYGGSLAAINGDSIDDACVSIVDCDQLQLL
jgi:hypothetical protein